MNLLLWKHAVALALAVAGTQDTTKESTTSLWADTHPWAPSSAEIDLLQHFSNLRAAHRGESSSSGAALGELDTDQRLGVQEFQYFNPVQRWGGTANMGDPITLTWSFAPDGALFMPTVPNALQCWMEGNSPVNPPPCNGLPNGPANWRARFQAGFDRWEELTGIDFEFVDFQGTGYDDGEDYGQDGAPGLRGDIRIFLVTLDGPGGLLAVTEPPNGIAPGPSEGEITFDAENWLDTPWLPGVGFDRSIMHEIGHAMGLDHSCPASTVNAALNTRLMVPFALTNFSGPQHDDIRGAQGLYGDSFEPNDAREEATPFNVLPPFPISLGPIPPPAVGPFPGSLLSIDLGNVGNLDDDEDWFTFTLLQGKTITLTVSPIGGFYEDQSETGPGVCAPAGLPNLDSSSIANLNMQVWRGIDKNDMTLLATADVQPTGVPEVLSNLALLYPGTYYVRVYSPGGLGVQLYNLSQTNDIPNTCSGDPGCSDGFSGNGTETCDAALQSCRFQYWDDDLDYNSIPDAFQSLADCNANGVPDVGEIAQPTARGADDCLDAQPIEANIAYEYTTVYADTDGPSTFQGCDSTSQGDVWFQYTPRTNGNVLITTCGSKVAMGLGVYLRDENNPCSAQVPVPGTECQFTFCSAQPSFAEGQVSFDGVPGQEYLIRVFAANFAALPAGDFTLTVFGPEDVTNDCNNNGIPDDCEALVDCNGNGIADECEMTGATNSCFVNANSAGPGALMSATGSLSISANNLAMKITGGPSEKVVTFFFGQSLQSNPQPFSNCLLPPTARVKGLAYTDTNGEATLNFDFTDYPFPIFPGSTWYFQAWYRDPGGPTANGTNYSDVMQLTFCN